MKRIHNKEGYKIRKNELGITLIALVLTIIILLILAGISIATLFGENGIIKQAQNAKENTEIAAEEEKRKLAMLNATMNFENQEYMDENNEKAIIPAGFSVTGIEGEDTIEDGLVITDKEGNEFVWVPVSKENFATEFVREHFGTEEQKWWPEKFSEEFGEYQMYEPVADGITVNEEANDSLKEVQKMYKSVKENGGFYVGRYESGKDEASNVTSKKGMAVYNNIGWSDSDEMTDETGGAVEESRGFADINGYNTVKSTLLYGVQWDAIMRWISKEEDLKGYLTDSLLVGNYFDSDETNNPAKTGETKEYQLKNIYDIAGNVAEWTMETFHTDHRVWRGGYFNDDGTVYPVSCRGDGNPSFNSVGVGFRIALYLDV